MPARKIRKRRDERQRRQMSTDSNEGGDTTATGSVPDDSQPTDSTIEPTNGGNDPTSTRNTSDEPQPTDSTTASTNGRNGPTSTRNVSDEPQPTDSTTTSTNGGNDPTSTRNASDEPQPTDSTISTSATTALPSATITLPSSSAETISLNGRQSAAIAVGVVGFVFLVAFVYLWNIRRRQKFKLWAPIRWNGGGIGLRRSSGDRSAAKDIELRSELDPDWGGLPVDDGTIMRRFKEIDDRIAGHVLQFYIPDNDVDEGEELRAVSHAKRRSVTSYVSSFEYLVSLEEARVYVLRALLSGIILEDFDEGAFFTDRYTDNCKRGRLTSDRAGGSGTDYHEARNRTVLRLADVAFEQLRPFVANNASSELRKRSMESVVQSVAQFAEIVEKQPARFNLVWQPRGFERPKKGQKKVPLHKEEMEPVVTIARDRNCEPKVRGVVFPGLEKTVDLESLLLAKIQVLVY